MAKKAIKKTLDIETIENLLSEQTLTILTAVDERLVKTEARMDARMDKKLLEMEERMNQKFDKLTTTLDNFLKRMLDNEDEMTIMKLDIIRLKKVIKEKVGVDLM